MAPTTSAGRDIWLIGLIAGIGYLACDWSGLGTIFFRFVADHPEYDIAEALLSSLVVGFGALVFSLLRWRDAEREALTRKATEERLDRAQEIAGIGSWELDVSTNRYVWSKQMYRLRGLTPGAFDTTSSAVASFVHPDDEPTVRQFRDDLKAGIVRGPIEMRVLHPSGKTRVLRMEGQPTIDKDGAIRRVSGTAQDITEQQLVQRQLAQAQKMEVIGHLAGGLAHDFNNVLGIIIANLELQHDYTANSPSADALRADALSGALHGAELTRQLLAFAQRQALRPRDVDVNELIRSLSRLLRRLLGEHIELDLTLDPALWPISVDPAQMEAALTNLASNAHDAMGPGGKLAIFTRNRHVESDVTFEYPKLAPGDYVLIEVSDTGTGICSDIIGRIFDPFFTTKEQGKGSGLGLSMVLGFITQSGGHVTVHSEPNAATTFNLYLPRSVVSKPVTVAGNTPPYERTDPGTRETVLVVEDNAQLRRAAVRQLVDLGYRVFEAGNVETAKVVLEINSAVALLFTDVVMPGGIDGLDLVEWALARRPDLCCLLTSGFSDLGGRERRLEALGCSVLAKPYQRGDLACAIRNALDTAARQPPH